MSGTNQKRMGLRIGKVQETFLGTESEEVRKMSGNSACLKKILYFEYRSESAFLRAYIVKITNNKFFSYNFFQEMCLLTRIGHL